MVDKSYPEQPEWSRYYRLPVCASIEAVHAHFVRHKYPRHAHDYLVVGLVESGVQTYWYRGQRHATLAGQIFLVEPDEPHTGEAATAMGYVYRTLCVRSDLLSQVARDCGTGRAPRFNAAVLNDRPLAAILTRLHERIVGRGLRAELDTLIFRVLAHLIEHYDEGPAQQKPIVHERSAVRRAREYLEAHFSDDVSLSDLAQVVSLSPFYLARAFNSEVGLPPHAYLEGVRIRKTCELLDRGEGLASTALAVGYSDQSHFTRRFKQFLGITPGQYLHESKIRQDARRLEPSS